MDPSRSLSNDPNHPSSSDPRAVVPTNNTDLNQAPPHPSFPLNISLNIEGPQRTYRIPLHPSFPLKISLDINQVPQRTSPIPPHPPSSLNNNPGINQVPQRTSPIPPHPPSSLNNNPGINQVPQRTSLIPPHPPSSLNNNPGINQAPPQRSPIPPHPSYNDMICTAISALAKPKGSTKEAISTYILRHNTGLNDDIDETQLTYSLMDLKRNGIVTKANRSYKLAVNENPPPQTQEGGRGGSGVEPFKKVSRARKY